MDDIKIIKRMTVITGVGIYLSGCMVLAGTPEAIRAYGDYQVGTQKTAKEPNNAKNQYLNMREGNEIQITQRETAKTFWQKLVEPSEVKNEQISN